MSHAFCAPRKLRGVESTHDARIRTAVAFGLMFAISAATPALAEFALYGSHAHVPDFPNWGLVEFDVPITGASTRIGSGGLMFDFDFSPEGVLYSSDGDYLNTVDLVTGEQTRIGRFDISPNIITGLAFAPDGTLVGHTNNGNATRLYAIDPTTVEMTEIGTTGIAVFGMDFGPDGVLYGAHGNGVYTLDPITGEFIEVVASTSVLFRGLDYGVDGVLRGIGRDEVGASVIHEIDPVSGGVTPVGSPTDVAAQALATIPEPAAAWLVIVLGALIPRRHCC